MPFPTLQLVRERHSELKELEAQASLQRPRDFSWVSEDRRRAEMDRRADLRESERRRIAEDLVRELRELGMFVHDC